jgi:hypothetical protein
MSCFRVPDGSQAGSDVIVGEDPEAEAAVERRVPRDVDERREGNRRLATFGSPDALYQSATDSLTLVTRFHAHLLDLRVAVDVIDEQIADRAIRVVQRDPSPLSYGVSGQNLKRQRLLLSHLGHADLVEASARSAFDAPKGRGHRRAKQNG